MVEKSDGSWWPCGDYWQLNLVTKRDMYLPPHMEDLSARLASKKVFSKLDLRKGCYQVPSGRAGCSQGGHHHPLWTVQDPKDALWAEDCRAVFPALHGRGAGGVEYVFIYLDNILVARNTKEEHKIHLEESSSGSSNRAWCIICRSAFSLPLQWIS